MNRRDFLKKSAFGLAALTLSGTVYSQSRSKVKRPNFIFILTDDQRYDALAFMGKYPWLKTPNLDKIRAEGAHFENAFVTHSICSPSRASFHTGTYSHVHGVIQNESRDYDDTKTPSYSSILNQNGYNTAFLGKWHLAWGAQPRPGFNYWLAFDAQGQYFDCPLNENGREYISEGYITDVLNAKSIEYIEQQSASRPFSMILSHKAVHEPFTPAPRHAEQYPDAKLPEPPNFRENSKSKPQWLAKDMMKGVFRTNAPGKYIQLQEIKREWNPVFPSGQSYTDFYRGVSAVDDGIGKIYEALEKKGLLENTVLVFAGDNGFFLGEHTGRLDKRLMYEESIRIPLLMRYPRKIKRGTTIENLTLNIDLAPTILELAGIDIPSHMQGRSWVPLLEGNENSWRKSFLYEYFVDLVPGIPTMVGVRTENWKLIHYPDLTDIDELYDLESDSYEKNNLALIAEYEPQKQELKNEMLRLMKQTGYNDSKWRVSPVVHQPGRKGSGLVLHYDFKEIENMMLLDVSGKNNNGLLLSSEKSVSKGQLGPVLACKGKPEVVVDNSESLLLKNGPFVIDVTVNPQKNGVVLARGGSRDGFAVFVQNGIPSFGYRANNSLFIADGKEQCLNKKIRITGMVYNSQAHLYIDGEFVSSIPVSPYYFMAEPAESMQIGGDNGTLVLDGIMSNAFEGCISDLKIFNTALTAKKISRL